MSEGATPSPVCRSTCDWPSVPALLCGTDDDDGDDDAEKVNAVVSVSVSPPPPPPPPPAPPVEGPVREADRVNSGDDGDSGSGDPGGDSGGVPLLPRTCCALCVPCRGLPSPPNAGVPAAWRSGDTAGRRDGSVEDWRRLALWLLRREVPGVPARLLLPPPPPSTPPSRS